MPRAHRPYFFALSPAWTIRHTPAHALALGPDHGAATQAISSWLDFPRPTGIHAHINMALLRLELLSRVPDISAEHVWTHLAKLYDLEELNDGEGPDWSTYAESAGGLPLEHKKASGDESDEEDNEEYILEFALPGDWSDGDGGRGSADGDGGASGGGVSIKADGVGG